MPPARSSVGVPPSTAKRLPRGPQRCTLSPRRSLAIFSVPLPATWKKMTSSLVLTRQMENGRAQGISSAQP